MAVIDAVVTDLAKNIWPKMLGGLLSLETVDSGYFKVGEGGWVLDPLTSLRIPRSPAAHVAEVDLDIIVDASRGAGSKRYDVGENLGYFQKALTPSDVTFEAPNIMKVSCTLLTSEYNAKDDGVLIYDVGGPYGSPEIWEIGIFDSGDNMVAYGTFDKQTKVISSPITNVVRIVFGA